MAAVSETIVHEFFELHGFLVHQQRKYLVPARLENEVFDFLVLNPRPETRAEPLPEVLAVTDLRFLTRAVVMVKGWHTETFSPGMLANTPEIFRFVEPAIFQRAIQAFGGEGNIQKILVVPALSPDAEARKQTLALLRARGVDAVILFHTILANLIEKVETNRNYQKSDVLQIIRLLKNYDFFREPQLDLFKTAPPRKPRKSA